MKHTLIFLAIILVGVPKLFSQSDFKEGYIIKSNNDTIYGLIDYRGIKANSKSCIFKINENAERQRFSPNDLVGYRFINSKYYISRMVQIADNNEKLFLEYLINGIVNIYSYRNDRGEHFLVDKGDGKLYELKNEEKIVYINDMDYSRESKEYIGLLKYIFRESSDIVEQVDHVTLNHKSLINIAHKYHDEVCSDKQCIIYESKLVKRISKFGLLVGMNAYTITNNPGHADFPNKLYYLQYSKFDIELFPSIGFFYKWNMPNVNEKIFFQYEIAYNHMNITTSNVYEDTNYNLTYMNDIHFTRNSINNSGSFKYEFPKGKIRPTFQFGGFFNYFLKTDYKRDLEVLYISGNTDYTDEFDKNPFSTFDFGVSVGMGLNISVVGNNDIFLDLKYQRGFGISLPLLNTHNLSLNLGYQIGK